MEEGVLTSAPTEHSHMMAHAKIVGWLEVIKQLAELDYDGMVSFLEDK